MRSGVPTIVAVSGSDAVAGRVVWSPVKSMWWFGMTAGGVLAIVRYATWSGFAIFVLTSAVTLCLGHSLGMHRRLIHRSYECHLWVERFFVYLGTLVGMAGPVGMVRTHDMRDWAQRQPACHDYFAHRRAFLQDAWWQLHCDVRLAHPPEFEVPAQLARDRVLMALERSWMLQQVPWAVVLWLSGGISWVLWGICLRVSVSLTGHWLVGHFAHRQGHRSWHVADAGVQGHNVKGCGLITFGECWHNNHHAFPGSARLGLYDGQTDPGWWVLAVMRHVGLAWKVTLPAALPPRAGLLALDDHAESVLCAESRKTSNGRPS